MGGGHQGVMTAGIVATGLMAFGPWPQLFYSSMARTLRFRRALKFQRSSTAISRWILRSSGRLPPRRQPVKLRLARVPMSRLRLCPNPAGADIEVDGAFVGDTPSTLTVAAGDHTISLKKPGFTPWERTVKVSGGKIQITAELQASGETPTQHPQ